jgi:hypothetical protein
MWIISNVIVFLSLAHSSHLSAEKPESCHSNPDEVSMLQMTWEFDPKVRMKDALQAGYDPKIQKTLQADHDPKAGMKDALQGGYETKVRTQDALQARYDPKVGSKDALQAAYDPKARMKDTLQAGEDAKVRMKEIQGVEVKPRQDTLQVSDHRKAPWPGKVPEYSRSGEQPSLPKKNDERPGLADTFQVLRKAAEESSPSEAAVDMKHKADAYMRPSPSADLNRQSDAYMGGSPSLKLDETLHKMTNGSDANATASETTTAPEEFTPTEEPEEEKSGPPTKKEAEEEAITAEDTKLVTTTASIDTQAWHDDVMRMSKTKMIENNLPPPSKHVDAETIEADWLDEYKNM